MLHNTHAYIGFEVIEGGPVPGALEFVTEAVKHFTVVIFSTRSCTIEGRNAMEAWLDAHGFPKCDIATSKPPCHVHIDDRCITFTGTFPTMDQIKLFRPWNETSAATPAT